MAEYEIIPKATIDAIEESIQRKRGETAPISPSQMPLAIDTIPSSVDGTDVPVGGIYFTKPDSNGNPTECYIIGYAPFNAYAWSSQLSRSYFPYLSKVSFINCKNITSIGDSAFLGCSSLTTVNLPDSLTSISQAAFRGCSSLTTVNLPDSLTDIGNYAFRGCSSLTTVNLPDSLTSIGQEAFEYCSSLTTVELPDSLTSIGNSVFWECSSLTTVELPDSLTSIGNSVFQSCTSLTDVTIKIGFNCNNLDLSASNRYTTETIVSWLEALADRTGQTAYKLTIGTTNLNKLTAEQKAIATNKNWTLA